MRHTSILPISATLCLSLLITACGPLRPGQDLYTGGRTALSHWEYQDAIGRLYQTQVLLNLIRIVEYGETPVHFEFSDISTTVKDTADASLGLSFVDNPSGATISGNVIIPNHDTPISFAPKASAARSVEILAKAKPVTGRNWVYDWYYRIAEQMIENPNAKWWADILDDIAEQDCACDRIRPSDIRLTYRGHTYKVRRCFPAALLESINVSTWSGLGRYCLAPADELGSLASILNILSQSRPPTGATFTFNARIILQRSWHKNEGVEDPSDSFDVGPDPLSVGRKFQVELLLPPLLAQDLHTLGNRAAQIINEIVESSAAADESRLPDESEILMRLDKLGAPLNDPETLAAYIQLITYLKPRAEYHRRGLIRISRGPATSFHSQAVTVFGFDNAHQGKLWIQLDPGPGNLRALRSALKTHQSLKPEFRKQLFEFSVPFPDRRYVSPTRELPRIASDADQASIRTERDILEDVLQELRRRNQSDK